ncbi:hypothetical protein AMTR_s00098p00167990 [Amborella trichopoda]|uniref:SHSP domain-containing protein n=1 Tax=Amborella trichopoda TaxID=13333 RepID=W1NX53_AMBTC|nr:hypothetical protein AMTR_s00098p00167990 [Amborella trichopoda]
MEVRWEGVADGKRWGIPLKEDVSLEDDFPPLLFSSMLFEKFFDPSDAFPLWEFEPDNLLIGDTRAAIDWFHTNTEYVLSSELPGLKEHDLQISVEEGKVVEISHQRRKPEFDTDDWRCLRWWEFGHVRRLEIPEDADSSKLKASFDQGRERDDENEIPCALNEECNA